MLARNISLIFTIMCTIAAIMAFSLGIDWIYEGHGLNPVLAFPGACFLITAPFFMAPLFFEMFGDNQEDDGQGHDYGQDLDTDPEDRVVALIDGRPMTAKQFYRQHAIDEV